MTNLQKIHQSLKRKTRPPKYRNKKVVVDGHKFDSMKEMRRYQKLMIFVRTGIIKDLELQPAFKISLGGTVDPVTGRKMAARKFTADFKYFDTSLDVVVVEEVKSPGTAKEVAYRLRRQLFLEQYGRKYVFREII